jgi:hypothetical protein
MNNFLLFAGDHHYDGSGWQQYKGNFETLELAEQAYKDNERNQMYQWGQIVDLTKMKVVKSLWKR